MTFDHPAQSLGPEAKYFHKSCYYNVDDVYEE